MTPLTRTTPGQLLQATDAELVARVLQGEREAFSDLVRRHQAVLYRHARGMGMAHEAAQDLVQDACVRAFVRIRQCRDPERFGAWLFRIFRNLLLDYTRDVRRREVPLETVADSPAPAPAGDPLLRDALARALGALPELLREAFLLRHEADHSYEEIAELTGSRVSAVKMRVHRAREQLRAALGESLAP